MDEQEKLRILKVDNAWARIDEITGFLQAQWDANQRDRAEIALPLLLCQILTLLEDWIAFASNPPMIVSQGDLSGAEGESKPHG